MSRRRTDWGKVNRQWERAKTIWRKNRTREPPRPSLDDRIAAGERRNTATGGVLLWRRRLVEIWYRQSLDHGSLKGPYFSLTVDGMRLAAAFMAVPANRAATFRELRYRSKPAPPHVSSQENHHAASRI
jgi:hypothetical protein